MPSQSSVDPTAVIAPDAVLADDVTIGRTVRVGARVSIGAGSVVGDHATLGDDVVLDDGVILSQGVVLRDGVRLGPGVTVGPNATFVASGFDADDGGGAEVAEHASIGANACVVGRRTIGRGAVVGAGAVVTHDVPPHAIVVGSPARIIGYQSSADLKLTRHLRASALDDAEFPVRIGRVTALLMPSVVDIRGALTFGEVPTHLPFTPRRYFVISAVPSREVRGEHAHRQCHQLLVCVNGEVSVAVDDGADRGEIVLDRPDVALHLPPMVWGSQWQYSGDGVLLVLASDPYDHEDYIREYDDFGVAVAEGTT